MARILIFSLGYYPRFVGGAEIAIKEITDRISSDEIEFDMLTAKLIPGQASFEKIGNINVYRIGMGSAIDKILFPLIGTIKTFSLLKIRKYDMFWAMMVTYSSGVPYIVNIFRQIYGRPIVPIVLTLQEGDSETHIKSRHFGLIGLSWRLALKRSTHVTAISKYLKNQALKFGHKGDISIIPNGVDYELFSRPVSDSVLLSLKNALNKKESDVFLITTSRLVEKNAVDDIISALIYLPSNIKLLVIGTGIEEENLRGQVKSLKLEERVNFLGYVEYKNIPQYLQVSDIFIRPSLSEGFGNSFVEAMAAGIPVIATPAGGILDFLIEAETGLFCEIKNPRSIAQKVEKLIKDPESRNYIVNNARKMVKERYDWTRISQMMKKLLD
jgi:glycosyltransferase involved in cell wall biosynthesis